MPEQTTLFTLHPQLAADTLPVLHLNMCDLLLTNDCRYLWCILVPRLPGLRDFHDVPVAHKMSVHEEIDRVSVAVQEQAQADKINVAALGNLVDQLHVHIIARHRDDAAWPGPIWGVGDAEHYQDESSRRLIADLRERLS